LKKTITIDTPLAELTLRKYEKPKNLSKRELTRKLCLSLGLLQPGDSRDVIVDILQVLLESKEELTSTQVEKRTIDNREKHKVKMLGIAPSNVRRQLLRLRDLFIVEKVKNNYRIKENSSLVSIFEEDIEQYYMNSIINRVKEYLKEADKVFS
jgi:DNA-binding transcriptional ArsR family regulator